MLKKSAVIFMSLILSVGCLTACSENSQQSSGKSNSSNSTGYSSSTDNSSPDSSGEASAQTSASDMFADGDYKDVTAEAVDAEITLSGNKGTISDNTRGTSGSEVTITSKGTYKISGTSEDVTIIINDTTKSGNIYLILDNVNMTNTSNACIYVESCDKLIIQSTGENSLTYNNSDTSAKADGAIYSKDDLTINGSGTLNIESKLHGIVCKDDLKITDSTLSVKADSIGIQSGKSLRIGGGKITINSGHDGIQLSNNDNTSYFYFEKAEMSVTSGYDGISVKAGDDNNTFTGYVTLNGGTLNITTASGAGSDNSKDSNTSQKGIKSHGDITISDSTVTISSADDSIHGNSNIKINSGTVEVSSSDDGITADGDLTIDGGRVTVSKSYEALEATNVTINSGEVNVTASDDGINCSGGSDTSSNDDNPWNSGNTDAKLTINGGNVYVNSSGDGLDSNGSIYITGGTVIVEGPAGNDNGALDKGDSQSCVASITGGTVLAIGSAGMSVNFDTGTQCSALVTLSGTSGTEISVDDGSDFKYTATKDFSCVVYSSPQLLQGNTYTLTAGSSTATADFSSSLYYSDVSGGMRGNHGVMGR